MRHAGLFGALRPLQTPSRHLVEPRRAYRPGNLLRVCSVHHAKIHHDGWIIELGPNRELTLRLPDGTIHTTAPPSRRTAA